MATGMGSLLDFGKLSIKEEAVEVLDSEYCLEALQGRGPCLIGCFLLPIRFNVWAIKLLLKKIWPDGDEVKYYPRGHPKGALIVAEELSSIPPEQCKEEIVDMTSQMASHCMDRLSSKYNVKRFPKGHPKYAAYIQELKRAILDHGPRPKFYTVQLAVDMKKRNEVSEREFVKEEAIRLLKSICGSSWENKFICVAVGNVFYCELFEDEANIVAGKEEVVSVQLAPLLLGGGVDCLNSDAPDLKTAAKPSSIPPEQVKKEARITFHKKGGDIYVCGIKHFPKGHPKRAEYMKELKRVVLDYVPRTELYAVQLAVDMNKKRWGVSKHDFVKQEAIRLLEGVCGSSSEDKFVRVAVGTVFFCELFEDEAKTVAGKKEVVRIQLAPRDGGGVDCPLSDAPGSYHDYTMFDPCSSSNSLH